MALLPRGIAVWRSVEGATTVRWVPEAEVIHSHDRSARYELARTYVLHRRLYELFKLRTIPTLPLLAKAIQSIHEDGSVSTLFV